MLLWGLGEGQQSLQTTLRGHRTLSQNTSRQLKMLFNRLGGIYARKGNWDIWVEASPLLHLCAAR